MYATLLTGGVLSTQSGTVSMIGAGIAAAFVGVILGNYVLKKKKITMRLIQQITGIMLFVIALLLGFGIL
jgi:putative Ca2+/H+ antiporter (TMEM165/GDT1 family)